ncbi:hypothetical protein CDL15_Pgr007319 [Punica granatum]|uniref:Uncharacterized protein n=1 Tax=Punica granatum TaxID=22663 RepID=A0A218X9T5_PUNGR|nr:hypothetical protein CDL15_Pgr007319 [Punica granatum]PKI67710.1 hypothetical protein CRG98_011923 [Punica granatum]
MDGLSAEYRWGAAQDNLRPPGAGMVSFRTQLGRWVLCTTLELRPQWQPMFGFGTCLVIRVPRRLILELDSSVVRALILWRESAAPRLSPYSLKSGNLF